MAPSGAPRKSYGRSGAMLGPAMNKPGDPSKTLRSAHWDNFDRVRDQLLARQPLPPLLPSKPFDTALTAIIDKLDAPPAGKACLHLLNDDLTRSHEIAQSQEGVPTFDYVHAIVHRREGDFSNSKYWFRHVGSHPAWAEVYGEDPAPIRFVERCQAAGKGSNRELEELQLRELAVLSQHAVKGE
jgi:hypothetical protein